jgi:hypothetical protein
MNFSLQYKETVVVLENRRKEEENTASLNAFAYALASTSFCHLLVFGTPWIMEVRVQRVKELTSTDTNFKITYFHWDRNRKTGFIFAIITPSQK